MLLKQHVSMSVDKIEYLIINIAVDKEEIRNMYIISVAVLSLYIGVR